METSPDEHSAAAIDLIVAFMRVAIGLNRANPIGPERDESVCLSSVRKDRRIATEVRNQV